jgi:excinuclease ABC subunit C
MRTITSELLRIPGIGEAKRRKLLEVFGSLQGVRDAPIAAIAALPGFGAKTAEKIIRALGGPDANGVGVAVQSQSAHVAQPSESPNVVVEEADRNHE